MATSLQLEEKRQEVNNIVTKYNKAIELKNKFNSKKWEFPQSKVNFDLNILHDLIYKIELQFHGKSEEYNRIFLKLNGYVII